MATGEQRACLDVGILVSAIVIINIYFFVNDVNVVNVVNVVIRINFFFVAVI